MLNVHSPWGYRWGLSCISVPITKLIHIDIVYHHFIFPQLFSGLYEMQCHSIIALQMYKPFHLTIVFSLVGGTDEVLHFGNQLGRNCCRKLIGFKGANWPSKNCPKMTQADHLSYIFFPEISGLLPETLRHAFVMAWQQKEYISLCGR